MAPPESPGIYRFDAFHLDPVRGAVLGPEGAELRLRPKAFALLRHLLDNPGRLLGREELLETLWPSVIVTDDSLTQCVSELRQALGERAARILKTVPKRGYVLIAEVERDEPPGMVGGVARPVPSSVASRETAATLPNPIRVHQLEAPDGDPACIFLAEATTDDLIAELTQLDWFSVLPATEAAASGFRIRGEVRAVGTQLRLTVRLEEATSGAAIWIERLERDREGPPGMLKATLAALIAHLNEHTRRHELSAARRKPLDSLNARELTLIGRDHHQRGTEADTLVAKEMFARAIATDPDFAPAYAWQAYTVHRAVIHGWGSPGGQAARDESLRLAQRAVQLAPDSPLCVSRLAFSLVLHQRWEEAVDAARSALASGHPTFAAARNACCEVLAHAGHPEEAVTIAEGTLALDPLSMPTTQAILGRALLLAGRTEEALAPLRACASRLPDYVWTYDTLVVAAVETGRLPEALAARNELLRLKPEWEPRNHTGLWFFRRPEDLARFEAAHRRAAELAGVPYEGKTDPAAKPLLPEATRSPMPSAPPAHSTPSSKPRVNELAILRRDALVVHPLRPAPDDRVAELAALSLTSDLMAELVRYENLRVVAGPDHGVQEGFALRGDVHAAGGLVHAVLRLDDLATGTMFWGKRVEWLSERAADVPAESLGALAAAVDVQIARKSLRRARQKPVERLTARELGFLGKELYQRGSRTDTLTAREMFARASALDPEYAPAHAWYALTLTRAVVHGWDVPSQDETIEQAAQLARRAAELEPESPLSLAALGLALGLEGRWEESVSAARLALNSDRAASEGTRITCGEVLTAAGYADEAEAVLRQTIAQDPHGSPAAHAVLGRALLLAGRPEEAVAELRLCAARLPDYALCFRTMVVAAVEAGLLEDARAALRELVRLRPGWVQGVEPIFWFVRRPEDTRRCQEAFRMALRLEAAAKAGGLMEAPTSRA